MLGENLQAARLAQNLTQEQVAKELYFSRQAISCWEVGKLAKQSQIWKL